MPTSRLRAAVVGSGFGGLAAAIRLQAGGFDTVVFEKRDLPGGVAHVYRADGFTFDGGPTVITAPDCLRELFALAGEALEGWIELVPLRPFYRLFWESGERYDHSNDLRETFRQIGRKSPADIRGYLDFLSYARRVYEEAYERLAAVPFLSAVDMLRVLPQLIRLRAHGSVFSTVARHIKDPELRQAFSFHSLLVGGNPFTTSSIYTLIHYLEHRSGVFFPRGGTGKLVAALAALFEKLGGELRLRAPVSRITTRNGSVRGIVPEGGSEELFDLVVSNADVTHTYRDLLTAEPLVEPARRRLDRMRFGMSVFLVYFGSRRKYPDLLHHNVIFGRRYRELLGDIFTRGRLADDFSVYLHAPTYTDPTLAPPGLHAFYVLSPVPHLGNLALDWRAEGPKYADRILDYLDRRYMPGLRQDIVTRRIVTPEDFRDELNMHLGSAFSLEPRIGQTAYFRVHNRDSSLKGLYFVGAGTHPGAGIPGVVNSAKATAGLVAKDFRLTIKERGAR